MKALTIVTLLLAVALAGCTTKSAAKQQAREAFASGQRQGLAEGQRVNIRVLGPVRNPEIPWTDGLTLAQAIAAAETANRGVPKAIFLIRKGERGFIDPKVLLRGEDVPLEPGDTVEVQP
jgi:hypothetical protein